jgi:hypothetical protein
MRGDFVAAELAGSVWRERKFAVGRCFRCCGAGRAVNPHRRRSWLKSAPTLPRGRRVRLGLSQAAAAASASFARKLFARSGGARSRARVRVSRVHCAGVARSQHLTPNGITSIGDCASCCRRQRRMRSRYRCWRSVPRRRRSSTVSGWLRRLGVRAFQDAPRERLPQTDRASALVGQLASAPRRHA